MKRCTFPAGCTEAATGVDAYDHPVCDRHAPLDFEIVVLPENADIRQPPTKVTK